MTSDYSKLSLEERKVAIQKALADRRDDISKANAHYADARKKINKHLATQNSNSNPNVQKHARYLPALSESYVSFSNDKDFKQLKLPFSSADLNFLSPNSKLFHYSFALYSAGQAASTPTKALKQTWVTKTNRNNGSIVIGDSSGFQIQRNKIEFEGDKTRQQMLTWLEANTDYSMILDFPTGGIEIGTVGQHVNRLEAEGHKIKSEAKEHKFSAEFMACLVQTELNNKYFQNHREAGATKLLNVMQGRNERESKFWYERMRQFNFEGIAFADAHKTKLSMTLRRILQMIEDGLLKECEWIHFLGISTLRAAAVYNALQDELRHHPNVNDSIQITFDSSSPSQTMAMGYSAYIGYDFDKWSFKQRSIATDEYRYSDMTLNEFCADVMQQNDHVYNFACQTAIGDHLKLKDMIVEIEKDGEKSLSLTSTATNCLLNHNTQAMIDGFRQLPLLFEAESEFIPHSILLLQGLIRAIINPANNIGYHKLGSFDEGDIGQKIIENVFISQLKAPVHTLIDETAHLLDALAMKVK